MCLNFRWKGWLFQAAVLVVFFGSGLKERSKENLVLTEDNAILLKREGNEIILYWNVENDQSLEKTNGQKDGALKAYLVGLKSILGEELFLRSVEREAFTYPEFEFEKVDVDGDRYNRNLTHGGGIGKIREINILEAQLLELQLKRYPLLSHPTEFQALILENAEQDSLKIYFTASDQPWPPKGMEMMEAVKTDIANGWLVIRHLHNHYEPKENNYIGIMAPSMADAQMYKMMKANYGLKKALITNGFHTVEIQADEFEAFASH